VVSLNLAHPVDAAIAAVPFSVLDLTEKFCVTKWHLTVRIVETPPVYVERVELFRVVERLNKECDRISGCFPWCPVLRLIPKKK